MLNGIWLALVLGSVLCAAFTGRMGAVGKDALTGAIDAVTLVIKLLGPMALFLGLIRVASDGGLLYLIARGLRRPMRFLFPDVPTDHPAMGAMIMNLASNALGLGNAATPFGLKAMVELDKLNRRPGVATDSMVLFLAINASSVALFPTGVIAVRASLGSQQPDAIWLPTLLATSASTFVAICMALALRRMRRFDPARSAPTPAAELDAAPEIAIPEVAPLPPPPGAMTPTGRAVVLGFLVLLGAALALHVMEAAREAPLPTVAKELASDWFLPVFMASLLLFGVAGRVRVYEAAVEGAKEALEVAVRIIPFLVMILVALAMLRSSGALDAVIGAIEPVTGALGIPGEVLPMALLRPLSGSGAYGVMVNIMETHGADSFVGLVVSSLQGSTETTFYVLTLYLGAARVRDGRHALPACLSGDLAAVLVAVAACHWLFA